MLWTQTVQFFESWSLNCGPKARFLTTQHGCRKGKKSCQDLQPFKPFFPSFFFRFLQQHFLIIQKQQRRTTRRITIPIVTMAHIGTEIENDFKIKLLQYVQEYENLRTVEQAD